MINVSNTFDVWEDFESSRPQEELQQMVVDLNTLIGNYLKNVYVPNLVPVVDASVRSYMALNWPDYAVNIVYLKPGLDTQFVVQVHHKDDVRRPETLEAAYDNFVKEMTEWMGEHHFNGYSTVNPPGTVEDLEAYMAWKAPTAEKETAEDILFAPLK